MERTLWLLPAAEPETRTWVEVVYVRGDPKKQQGQSEKSELRIGGRDNKGRACELCGQLELSLAGDPLSHY